MQEELNSYITSGSRYKPHNNNDNTTASLKGKIMAQLNDANFDSEVPFNHKSSFKEVSLGQCLEILNEDQLTKLIDVVAKDYQLKYDLFRNVHKQNIALEEFGKNHPPRSGSCAFCWQAFRIFRREIVCHECPRNVCSQCQVNGMCKYCHEILSLSYKRAELRILVPYGKDLFGYCKMTTFDRLSEISEFQVRATLELHLSFLLETEIDAQYIMFIITDMDLHFCRDRLQKALENFEQTSHFQAIDDAVEGLRNLLSGRSNCLFECKSDTEEMEYYRLISNAVIYALYSKKEAQTPLVQAIQRFVEKRSSKRVKFPALFPKDLEHEDFGKDTDWIQPSRQCRLNDNWFMKPKFPTPEGGQCSQASHFVNGFLTSEVLHNGYILDENGNEVQEFNEELEDVDSFLKVHMERSVVEASSGQLVKVRSRIISDQPEEVDVLWFSTRREIVDGSRTRLIRSHDVATLEIFDCDPAEDAGELFCIAISDLNISSDVSRLVVYREDLAGDEPEFVEPLRLSRSQSRLFMGGFMVLKCRVNGYPVPYANFFFKNRVLKNFKCYQIEHSHDVWTLRVWNLSADDQGTYKCVISNRMGSNASRINIKMSKSSQDPRAQSFEVDEARSTISYRSSLS